MINNKINIINKINKINNKNRLKTRVEKEWKQFTNIYKIAITIQQFPPGNTHMI